VIGNVGDSRAVLSRRSKLSAAVPILDNIGTFRGRVSRKKKLEIVGESPEPIQVLSSIDHRPWRKEEIERVLRESEGRGRVSVGSDGKTMRVLPSPDFCTHEQMVTKHLGLAMTRSLGHAILSQCGISSEPEFFSTTLEDGDKLIIGCDGLWDVISNEEAMGIVALYAGQTPQAACEALVREAQRRWKQKHGGDNITAVVVFFNC